MFDFLRKLFSFAGENEPIPQSGFIAVSPTLTDRIAGDGKTPEIIRIANGDWKDYLIERLNKISKVVDEKKISDNLLRKPQH